MMAAISRYCPRLDMRWLLLWAVALFVTAKFAHRYVLNPDALAYIEVGEAWWRGDFKHGINGYWNPLFPILAAAAVAIAGATADPVGPQLLNIGLFIAGWVAYRFFLREALSASGVAPEEFGRYQNVVAPTALTLFVWATAYLIDVAELTPDLLLLIWVLLGAGYMLRMRSDGRLAPILAGLFLGLCYLTKSVMFPLGIVFLVSFLFNPLAFDENARASVKERVKRISLASAVFIATSGLYIVPLSLQKGRPTFGDSGRLAYAWEVNHFSPYFHWQGAPPESGHPRHPTRQILDWPPTFEFESSIPATYSPWFEPSYWNEGLKPRFRIKDQVKRLEASAERFCSMLARSPVPVLGVLVLFTVGFRCGWRRLITQALPFSHIFLGCIAALALYSLVFLISRYVAPFALIGSTLLAIVCFRANGPTRNAAVLSTVFCLAGILFFTLAFLNSALREIRKPSNDSYLVHQRVADRLRSAGVNAQDTIAVIGAGRRAYFARILKCRVVAETLVHRYHPVWPQSAESFAKIAEAITAYTSARVIVSTVSPPPNSGWHSIPGTDYTFKVVERSHRNKVEDSAPAQPLKRTVQEAVPTY